MMGSARCWSGRLLHACVRMSSSPTEAYASTATLLRVALRRQRVTAATASEGGLLAASEPAATAPALRRASGAAWSEQIWARIDARNGWGLRPVGGLGKQSRRAVDAAASAGRRFEGVIGIINGRRVGAWQGGLRGVEEEPPDEEFGR